MPVSNLTENGRDQDQRQLQHHVNETQLIALVIAGDRLAGRTLYDTHAPRVYSLAYRLSGDAEKAREFTAHGSRSRREAHSRSAPAGARVPLSRGSDDSFAAGALRPDTGSADARRLNLYLFAPGRQGSDRQAGLDIPGSLQPAFLFCCLLTPVCSTS